MSKFNTQWFNTTSVFISIIHQIFSNNHYFASVVYNLGFVLFSLVAVVVTARGGSRITGHDPRHKEAVERGLRRAEENSGNDFLWY